MDFVQLLSNFAKRGGCSETKNLKKTLEFGLHKCLLQKRQKAASCEEMTMPGARSVGATTGRIFPYFFDKRVARGKYPLKGDASAHMAGVFRRFFDKKAQRGGTILASDVLAGYGKGGRNTAPDLI